MADIEAQIQLDSTEVLDCSECGASMDVSDLAPFTEVECPVCNHRDTVPAKLGQFTLLNMINTGGMGAVYRGRDDSLGRLVAIKVMLKKLGEDPKVVEDFTREAQAAARLNHPNVAQIYSFGQAHSQPYIAMELVSGKRFDKMIEERKALDPGVVMKVAIDIAEGLKAADEIGLVHGDVKPENILLDERNNAKLVDFGIASFADQAAPEEGIWGTPYYIAPEKVKRKKSDARSDIYSLGATLYHALSGEPPFDGETPVDVVRARLETTPEPLNKVKPEIPEGLSDAVARMLEMEPARRHPTYASLIGDLRRELGNYTKKRTGSLNAGMTGKRIRIKKSAGASAATVASTGEDTTREAAPGGKRTVKIAKRSTPGRVAVSTVKKKTPEQIKLERKQKARARAIQATIVGIILVLAGGGVIGVMVKKNHDKKLAMLAREHRLRIARDECETLVGKVKEYSSAVALTGKRIEPLIETVEDVVQFVEEQPLSSFYGASARPAPAPDADAPAAPPEAGAPAFPEPAPAPKPPKLILDEDGREAPFEGLSREEDDRQRAQRNKEDAEPAAAPDAAPPKEAPKADAVSQDEAAVADSDAAPANTNDLDGVEALIEKLTRVRDPIDGPEVVVLADQVVIFSERIEKRIVDVNTRVIESETMREMAETTRDPVVGESQVTNINAHLEYIQRSKDEMSGWITEAKEITAKVSQIRMATKARREREAQEAADRAKAEAYADLVKREKEMVAAVEATGTESLLANRFKEAVDAAEALVTGLKTEEAKADLKIVIERFTIVNGVRDFLIQEISKTPYRWGWRTTGGAEDIEGADKDGISIRSGKVPWKDISLPRLSQIVTHYLKDNTVAPSVKSSQLIGLAVLCRLHSRTSVAEQFESKATFASPYAQDIIERIRP